MIHTKFVDHVLDFPKIQKRGAKKGGSAIWAPLNIGFDLEKVENFDFFTREYENERGGQKGGAAFPNVGSDQIYHNMRL